MHVIKRYKLLVMINKYRDITKLYHINYMVIVFRHF